MLTLASEKAELELYHLSEGEPTQPCGRTQAKAVMLGWGVLRVCVCPTAAALPLLSNLRKLSVTHFKAFKIENLRDAEPVRTIPYHQEQEAFAHLANKVTRPTKPSGVEK